VAGCMFRNVAAGVNAFLGELCGPRKEKKREPTACAGVAAMASHSLRMITISVFVIVGCASSGAGANAGEEIVGPARGAAWSGHMHPDVGLGSGTACNRTTLNGCEPSYEQLKAAGELWPCPDGVPTGECCGASRSSGGTCVQCSSFAKPAPVRCCCCCCTIEQTTNTSCSSIIDHQSSIISQSSSSSSTLPPPPPTTHPCNHTHI
jgi:hypothetical protein